MARLPKGQLSHHPAKGFRVCVGTHQSKDGDVRPRTFWLGHDPVTAQYAADQFRGAWNGIQLCGRQHWTDDEIRGVQQSVATFVDLRMAIHRKHTADKLVLEREGEALEWMFGPPPGKPALDSERGTPAAPAAEATLYGAITRYLETFKSKRRSDSHKARAAHVLNVNLKKARKDCPLAEIDYLWVDSLSDYFKARPPSLKNGNPISATTVAIILRYLRAFFVWIDDSGFGGWEGPRKLTKPFKCNVQDLMTPAELRTARTIEQFDTETLGKLYRAASDFQKALLLSALFTGATQQELAVLQRDEFDLKANTLHHFRNKTKIEGRFWLPPELVKLLRKLFKDRPGDDLAFRTKDGNALVTFKDGRQSSDAVRQTWDDLRTTAKVPETLSFKYLRKFLGDWMMRHGGEAMGQIALSHARETVLAKNYTTSRDFDGFNALQRQMYLEFKSKGMFDTHVRAASTGKTRAA